MKQYCPKFNTEECKMILNCTPDINYICPLKAERYY